RAQAGRLAVDGRGRARRAAVAGGQLGEEVGDVGRAGGERIRLAPGKELPKLVKIRAVRVERVAGEPPLEFEVGEEVEDQPLELGDRLGGGLARGLAAD